jgi:hypothetical protein
MQKKNLASFVKEIIKNQTTSVDSVVSNLYGTPLVGEQPVNTPTGTTTGTWRVHTLPVVDYQYSPDEIIGKLSTIEGLDSPTVQSIDGVLDYNSLPGNSLATTIVETQQAMGVTIQVEAVNKQIAIYMDETIVRRGFSRLVVTVNLPAGKNPLNIVTVGSSAERVRIILPSDLTYSIQGYIPPTPNWLDSGSINTNYVDPVTGSTGMSLNWFNQDTVGGWNIYRVESQPYGIVSGAASSAGRYYFCLINSGYAPYISSVLKIENRLVGVVDSSVTDGNNGLFLTIIPFSTGYDASVYSGSAYIVSYRTIGTIAKNSTESVITFVDMNVKKGDRYAYTIDSYSPYDPSLRSSKAPTISAVAGDIYPPGNITLHSVTESGGRLNVAYTPPSDEDYLATRVIKYWQGSGVGTVANIRIMTDFGYPSVKDSMLFEAIGSGTYYFVTSDQVGNQQYVLSGVPYYYTGVVSAPGVNLPPTLRVSQLSSSEMTVDSKLFAQFRLEAIDPESSPSTIPQYIIMSGTGAGWQTAPSNPFIITMGRSNRDAWVRARAFDGVLYSDELLFVVDYDTSPEIASVYARYMIASGTTFINGSVDDDCKSLRWMIIEGAEPGDPTIASPTLINNLDATKTFSFSFPSNDGTRKVVRITPYPDLGGNGSPGLSYEEEFIRLPRSRASVSDRTSSGSVSKTHVFITLSASPDSAVIFDRVTPIDYGTVTSGIASTLTDNTQSWISGTYDNGYEVKLVAGLGEGQIRTITSTQLRTLLIDPVWTVIPNSTTKYYIREKFRHYSDNGKATSATTTTLVDNTKAWYPNEFVGKDIFIYSGTGVGQVNRTITANGATQVNVTPDWNPVPNSSSAYKIFGPLKIARDSIEDTTVDFYSQVIANGLTEEIQSITVDSDDIPEINTATITEPSNNMLVLTVSNYDEDTKYWSAWLRRNNWPTILSGSANAALDDDYIRVNQESIENTQIQFAATTGFWYGVVLPYDSYNNVGPRLVFSGSITGAVTSPPAQITSINVEPNDQSSDLELNRIWWNHNSTAEKPGAGNGVITIKGFAYRSDEGLESEEEITNPATRYSWSDSEDTDQYKNTDDTLNSRVGRGSLLHRVNRGVAGTNPWLTWYYKIRLISGSTTLADYNTSHSDYYDTAPLGTSNADSTWTPTSDSVSTGTPGTVSGTAAPINTLTGTFPAQDNNFTVKFHMTADASGMNTGSPGGFFDCRCTSKIYYSDNGGVNWTYLTEDYVQNSKSGVNQAGGTSTKQGVVTVAAGTSASQMRFKAEVHITIAKGGSATGSGTATVTCNNATTGNVTWFVEAPLP